MESSRCAQCIICGGGAARVEETWRSREKPSPRPAAARRRKGAIGEAFAEPVPLYAEGDTGLAVGINTIRVVLLLPVVEVILYL